MGFRFYGDPVGDRTRAVVFIDGYHSEIGAVDGTAHSIGGFYISIHPDFHGSISHIGCIPNDNKQIVQKGGIFELQIINGGSGYGMMLKVEKADQEWNISQ